MTRDAVLVIGGDAEARKWLASQVLQPGGYLVDEARDVAEARSKIASFQPHLCFLILSEHPVDELALVAEHEAILPSIVVVPDRSLEAFELALAHGACDVLQQPLEPPRVTSSLTRVLRRSRIQRERDSLREQTGRQVQEFNALYTVGQKVAALFDIEEILKLVVTAAVNLTQAEEGALMLLDAASGELYLRASCNSSDDAVRNLRIKVTDSLMGRIIQSGRPIMLERSDLLKIKTALLVKAIVGVPLIIGGHAIGVLSAYYTRSGRRFAEHDVHLLATLADSAAIAIRNAELYHDVRRTADRFAALTEIDRRISESLDLQTVLERIATHAKELLGADDSEVYLRQPPTDLLTAIVALGDYAEEIKAQPLKLGEGIVGAAALTGTAEMVNDAQLDPRSKRIAGTPDEHEALLCAPLLSKGNSLGVMAVSRVGSRPAFDRLDFEFFIALAAQAAIAIENARLYDIERQRAVELGIALTQQQELDRLKNAFVQNVSHELRTPLAIIRGYAELLTSGDLGDLTEQQRESVAVMTRRARMLGKMLDDLLTILAAETHKLEKELVDLAAMVELVVTDFQAAAKQAELTLTASVAPGTPYVYVDAIHLRRVLDNLLGNALKFTPAGGRISVALSHSSQAVVLEVADTGVGIPPEHLAKIFQRFYQVDNSSKRRFGGVGLGLALVKEIIESHEGSVEVSSAVAAGTTFRITLPAVSSPANEQLTV